MENHVFSGDKFKRKDKSGENPFSFKKFLKGGARPKTGPGSGGSGLATLDFASDLPDFVQDHFCGERRNRTQPNIPVPDFGQPRNLSDVPLPDFALDSSNLNLGGYNDPSLPSPTVQDGSGPLLLDGVHRASLNRTPDNVDLGIGQFEHDRVPTDDDVNNEDNNEELEPLPVANATGGLPDFLSDSAVNNSRGHLFDNVQAISDDDIYHMNGDLGLEIRRVTLLFSFVSIRVI